MEPHYQNCLSNDNSKHVLGRHFFFKRIRFKLRWNHRLLLEINVKKFIKHALMCIYKKKYTAFKINVL